MAGKLGQIRIRWRLPTGTDAREASEAAIRKAALKALSLILRRTAKGIDARGAIFRPYGARYAKAKAEAGRNASPPDLTLTGTLLRGLRLLRVESPRRAIIGWEGQHVARNPLAKKVKGRRASKRLHSVAYAVLVPALNRKRRFFTIESVEEMAAVRKVYIDTLRAEMRRRLGGR